MKNDFRLPLLIFGILLCAFSNAQATTYTFTATTGDWNLPSNWQDNNLPPEPIASGDIVVIPLGNLVTVPVGYTITNNGIISIDETDGVTAEGKMAVHGVLNNNGRIQTGRMEINGLYNHNPGATIERGGTVYVRPGGIFNVVGNLVSIFSLGNLGTLNILPSGVLDIRGTFNNIGVLVNDGTFMGPLGMWDNQVSLIKGSGIFTSNFAAVASTASTIAPGNSVGCLTFAGNFNNSATIDKLIIDINGLNPCTDFDKLIVGGTATIGGTLEVNFGFTPTASQTFKIIDAAAIVGSFSTINVSPTNISVSYSAGILSVTDVLSTELTNFLTELKDGVVYLDWQTASENKNKGFEIERSLDGNQWVSLGFVLGKAPSNAAHSYSFNDQKPNFGKNYYRLRLIDMDGQSTFSTIQELEFPNINQTVHIYPNPASEDITVQFQGNGNDKKMLFELLDIFGRSLITKTIDFKNSSEASIKLDNLENGFYQIRLISGQKVWVNSLVVEK